MESIKRKSVINYYCSRLLVMVETGRSAQSQAGAAGAESQIKSKHVIAGKPLDFSFLKISSVACKYDGRLYML